MTVVAAAEVISAFNSHDDMEVLEVEWGVSGRYGTGSKSARVAGLSKITVEENPEVMTAAGRVSLARALIERAIKAPSKVKSSESWNKLVAGLRFDGFEIVETITEMPPQRPWGSSSTETIVELRRMLPSDVPEADFREAESEVEMLLDRHGFDVAKGHLKRAISAFSGGAWSSANGELRNFYESYLNEIADKLGYAGFDNSKAKRDFLGGGANPPFLLADYNEWDSQKTQYVQALMNRLHPHGGHPGLSEEEDATFRLQITLVTARLFLRRFDQRAAA
ncbi:MULTISPECIES: hypothetical protein [unclassified Mesorhizobium]|uniref:hypothetical protein n=1 Tax=unclassified Mesorhizobium TaxID=325217 RepID=UPI001CC973F9|nr:MULTISPECIES: hypothetical protein [unclassified Mesorhizobium]MBZ9703242.1 hypothetical protein [Mesorhizobium sp. CO1-1-3]MBZ9947093.1 hypothetical protein [Mesorhizobium sp. BR1-1-11]